MQITADNLDKLLSEGGLSIFARMKQGSPHLAVLSPGETVTYAPPLAYNDTASVMQDIRGMPDSTAAIITKLPHHPSDKYTVKFGEVLP